MNTSPTQQQTYDDEIDLIELVQDLWQEKLIIIVLTLLVFIATAAYAFTAKPVFNSSLTLTPAKIGEFGDYVAKMDNKEKTHLVLANEATSQFLDILADSLQANLNTGITSYTGRLAVTKNQSKVNRAFIESVGLTLTSTNKENLQQDLINYLEAVSQETLKELNDFTESLGTNQQVTQTMLYRATAKPSSPAQVKPKKKLILAVGLVAGGMLGVFAALVRSMLRKRAKQLAQQPAA